MKFTIIMPTYNDCVSIEETLDSIINQSYKNWELLISDDGSTDNTKEVVERYIKNHKEKRIKYFYQENQDQLNAILNVMEYITGDYIYILHSDDLFANNDVLKNVLVELKNSNIDAIISSPITIDENSITTGMMSVKKYAKKDSNIALQLLWLGRNLYIDFAVHKKESFITNVKNNYLIWNTPFWLDLTDKPKMLNIKNVEFPFFKYRVFEGNYINNEVGKLNVINGELRTAINLMKYYDIPFYRLQYLLFRLLNKFKLSYKPFYFKRESKNKSKVIKFIIQKRYKNDYIKYSFLNNLVKFYEKINNDRTIEIDTINRDDFIYYGKDMRKFNNDLLNKRLSFIYEKIINEMENGFSKIIVKNEIDKKTITDITKFLCIYPFIEIEVKR